MVLASVEEDCARRGAGADSWALGCRLFSALAGQGLGLSRGTYEQPLRACCAAGRWEAAAALVREMRRDGVTVGAPVFEAVVCSKISHAASQREAAELVKLSSVRRGTTRTMNALLACALRHGDLRAARRVRREMQQREVGGDTATVRLMLAVALGARRWASVLRHFLFLKATLEEERAAAAKKGYAVNDGDYEFGGDVVRMVVEACAEVGLDDAVARGVLAALQASGHDVPLLGGGGAASADVMPRQAPQRRFLNVPD
jgi:pentatricopeptide repeat protein